MKDDLVNLLSLVALLVSTAGFKDELSSIKLGDTEFTLFTVFSIASVVFGILLYLHLFINGAQLLRQAWREQKKSWLLIILRSSFVAMLAIVPLGSVYIATSNWLYKEQCFQGYVSEDPFDPFASSRSERICQSPVVNALPVIASVSIVVIPMYFIFRDERQYSKLSPKAKELTADITTLRIMQAMSSNVEKNSVLEAKIVKLQNELTMEDQKKNTNK